MSATTRVSYTLDSGTVASRVLSFSAIDLLPEEVATVEQQIDIYHTPVGTINEVLLTVSTEYTLNESTKQVTLDAGLSIAVGDIITIDRDTDRAARYIDFTGLSFLDAEANNNDSDNLLHLIQEIWTNVADALQKNTAGTAWNGENLPSTNCANATDSTGWATLGQVVAIFAGGEPMDVGSGIYAEANGDNSTTVFNLPAFPTTDITDAKIFVSIDGIIQRPDVDYDYTLNSSSVPTVTFKTGAPPTGTGNIQFRVMPGVVTTTYDAATIDGSSIIDNTLDGAAVIDDTLDGDALVDQSVDLAKLDGGTGTAGRIILIDAAGVCTADALDLSDLTLTGGSSIRTDIGDSEIVQVITSNESINGTPGYTWTNNTSTTVFLMGTVRAQVNSGSVRIEPDGGTEKLIYIWEPPGGAVQDMQISMFVPPNAEVHFYGGGSDCVIKYLTYQVV